MTMTNTAPIEEFLQATNSFAHAMIPTVSYVSWDRGGRQTVVKARLRFTPQGIDFAPRRFAWNGIVAESFLLETVQQSPRAFIESALNGRLTSPGGVIDFLPQSAGSYAVQHFYTLRA
jgi:hypothetical protein